MVQEVRPEEAEVPRHAGHEGDVRQVVRVREPDLERAAAVPDGLVRGVLHVAHDGRGETLDEEGVHRLDAPAGVLAGAQDHHPAVRVLPQWADSPEQVLRRHHRRRVQDHGGLPEVGAELFLAILHDLELPEHLARVGRRVQEQELDGAADHVPRHARPPRREGEGSERRFRRAFELVLPRVRGPVEEGGGHFVLLRSLSLSTSGRFWRYFSSKKIRVFVNPYF